jgi:AcrR family transcriptional regulator
VAGKTRRRGAELEAALLDAAWSELAEAGYARLTMEAVAARAHTGIAVLYRRWANKDELALAAIEHYSSAHPNPMPDTGSLRGDLIALLEGMGQRRVGLYSVAFGAALSGLLESAGLSVAQFRERMLGSPRTDKLRLIYRRARERGEIDLEQIPAAVLTAPVDLVRHDLLMEADVVSERRITSIVDDLVLPLVLPTGTKETS